ncbi:MAG: iron ABC transporter permease [Candidatus Eisenbacteria bacterium]|nr:iron ABC transporter permease [Candidatus Eisenbacteria bacterium]MCC7140768.1 iron ABC transporter permease [Candidatus Eisenbacteria bacterium]
MTRSPAARLALLFAALLVVGLASLMFGAVSVSPTGIVRALLHASDEPHSMLIRNVRLPRVLLAALVGAALSISGVLLQAFFQNPMAGPYTVGVSAGSGLLAVLVIVMGWGWVLGPFDATALAAFLGGLLAVGLVYGIARRMHALRSEGLLLVGIAVGAVLSAFTSLLLVMSKDRAPTALFWMLGSFSSAGWRDVQMVAILLLVSTLALVRLSRDLNLLLWGEETAASLGSPVDTVRRWVLVHSSLLAAASVAVSGAIAYVGLMVPHIARGVMRTSDHRWVLPASIVIGAALVLIADLIARTVVAPIELPVGAITSLFGAPFLVYLVMRRAER